MTGYNRHSRSPEAVQHRHKDAWLLVAVLFLAAMVPLAKLFISALFSNMGYLELVRQAERHGSQCQPAELGAANGYLLMAQSVEPTNISAWRGLLWSMGRQDRQWVADAIAAYKNSVPNAVLTQPAEGVWVWALHPERTTNIYRCETAWNKWTAALIHATMNEWDSAVRDYQTGFALMPGYAPSYILQEYYRALGHHLRMRAQSSLSDRLAAAKYLALGGETDVARFEFEALAQSPLLTATQRCDATLGALWLQTRTVDRQHVPPWPGSTRATGESCLSGAHVSLDAASVSKAEWLLNQVDSLVDPTSGNRLAALDVDHDVLDAGAEVIGAAYWQTSDGKTIEAKRFRQANLWPNAGNTWLRPSPFASDLPGYTVPPWADVSAGSVLDDPAHVRHDPVGQIEVHGGQDVFLLTTSFTVAARMPLIIGGWWWTAGEFDNPHIARTSDTDPSYEVMLDLKTIASWKALAHAIPPRPARTDSHGWIRPQSGRGKLLFDDIFLFTLPGTECTHRSFTVGP